MSAAEAEMARLAQDFHVEATSDFGRLESEIQKKIDLNRAQVRVAADLSDVGGALIREEQALHSQLAEDALREFERQLGTTQTQPANPSELAASAGRARVAEPE
jgi:hypothetical protein